MAVVRCTVLHFDSYLCCSGIVSWLVERRVWNRYGVSQFDSRAGRCIVVFSAKTLISYWSQTLPGTMVQPD